MYQRLKKDCTGTFPGEIVTGRKEGESHEDYRARRAEFNRRLRGFNLKYEVPNAMGGVSIETKYIKGHLDGKVFHEGGTYRKPVKTIDRHSEIVQLEPCGKEAA